MRDPAPVLVLASASPRRRELLAGLGVKFEVVVPQVTEHEDAAPDPRVMVCQNAELKAAWVAERRREAWVLGADTTVFVEGRVLNKPADLAEARRMLRLLSGRTHRVCTGLSLQRRSEGAVLATVVESEVQFKVLDEAVIDRYLARVDPLDKAGAYAIQQETDLIIAGWRGSYTNIVGLPVEETKQFLTLCGLC